MSEEEILTQDEKDTLLKGVSGESEGADATPGDGEVRPYDFKHPAHKLKAHLPLLEVANHRFAEAFSAELSTLLRQTIKVELSSFSMLKHEEYSHSLETGASINRVKLSPLPGTSLMCLDPSLIFTMVDRFFGGSGAMPESTPVRPFTDTERRLIDHAIDAAFKCLSEAWAAIFNINPEFVRAEIGQQVTSPANPAEVLVTSKFKVAFSKGEGEFHIAIPYSSIEPVKPLLRAMIDKPDEDDIEWTQRFGEMVLDATLDLRGVISETPINLKRLLEFREGEFIPLGQHQQATFYVENVPLFKAVVGASNGMISAKII